jgi:hypothetical protein
VKWANKNPAGKSQRGANVQQIFLVYNAHTTPGMRYSINPAMGFGSVCAKRSIMRA